MSVLKIWNGSEWIQVDSIKGEQGPPPSQEVVDNSIQDALADYVAVSDVTDAFACDVASKKAVNFAFTIADTDAKEITFANVPTGRCEVFLEITTSAEPGAITWTLNGGSVAWSTGSAPVMVTGKVYRILFFTSDGGTNWDAFASVGL